MLTVAEVSVAFGGFRALSGVSLQAGPGSIVGIVGPNGSGKSTLLNVISGLQAADSGEVRLNGRPVPPGRPELAAAHGIGRTFQIPRLARRLTVLQNMMVGARQNAGELSGGQQKLLSLGMLLMSDPAVLLLDEPAAGVNPVLIEQEVAFLRSLRAEGRIILLVEHNMEMIANLCDRVHVLDAGEMIAEGTPEAIRRDARVMRSYLGQPA